MSFLKRIWSDPVWSKVISAGIIGAVVLLGGTLAPSSSLHDLKRWATQSVFAARLDLAVWAAAAVGVGIVTGYVVAHRARSGQLRKLRQELDELQKQIAVAKSTLAQSLPELQRLHDENRALRETNQQLLQSTPSRDDVLEQADWYVLHVIAQRRDPEQVPRFQVLALTGFTPLRADVAFDRLKSKNMIVVNGTDRYKDQVYGLLPDGRRQALRLQREHGTEPMTRTDDANDLDKPGTRALRWLRINHAPECWTSLEDIAKGTYLSVAEVEAGLRAADPLECVEWSEGRARLNELGETVFPPGGS